MRYLRLKGEKPTGTGPIKEQNRDWRPWAIQPPFLIFFVCLCFFLTFLAEGLLRKSECDGGLMFGDLSQADGELSAGANFIFNYLPTIVSVVFGLLWAVAEHDYKRIEPFFQLSRPEGATAEDSILLDYPYSNPLTLPYVSFKRRHYAVFYSSTMALFAAFFVIPIMSGIFEERTITRSIDVNLSRASIWNETTRFTPDFSYTTYRYAWLNGSLPDFTTADYAVLPFLDSDGNVPSVKKNETWVGETILYEADLQCQEAEATPITSTILPGSAGFNLSNGKDCNWLFVDTMSSSSMMVEDYAFSRGMLRHLNEGLEHEFSTPWSSLFFGHANATKEGGGRAIQDLYSLSSVLANCPSLKDTKFLGIWGSAREPYVINSTQINSYLPQQWTAVFCKPTYWFQPAKATVRMQGESRIIENAERFGERKPFQNFNSPDFEALAATGWTSPPPADLDSLNFLINFGYTPPELPDSDYRLAQRFGTVNATISYWYYNRLFSNSVRVLNKKSLAGLALHKQSNETLSRLLDPVELAKTYTEAYKFLFAFAVASRLVDIHAPIPATVTRRFEADTFAVNTLWCRLSQTGFVVMAALAICLLFSTWGRQCHLDGEPNSLLESMLVITESLSRDMHNSEYRNPVEHRKLLVAGAHRYQLHLVDNEGPVIERMDNGVSDGSTLLTTPAEESEEATLKPFESKISWELSLSAGVAYFVFFGGLLVFLNFLYLWARNRNGLPTVASTNSFGYKILFTFIPTVLGMLVEPAWVVLGSYACMVGPYEILSRASGKRKSTKSLALDYDKTPPHFQLWQAVKVGNFVLFAITIAILLANLLAVAFGGLFSPNAHEFKITQEMNRFSAPLIVQNISDVTDWGYIKPRPEMYYILAGNLSQNSTLPSWTTPDLYILPFSSAGPQSEIINRQGTTFGFGANVSCQLMPDDTLSRNTTVDEITYPVYTPGGILYNELDLKHPCWVDRMKGSELKPGSWFRWIEEANPAVDFFLQSPVCNGTFFVGWGERPGDPHPTNFTYPYLNRTDYVVLTCTSTLKIQEVMASVDKADNVLSYDVLNTLSHSDTNKYFGWHSKDPATDFESSFQAFIAAELQMLSTGWQLPINGEPIGTHFNPHPLDWINNLMIHTKPELRRPHLTNVSHVPDPKYTAKAFEDVYKSLFAIYLQLYADTLFQLGKSQKVLGSVTTMEDRVEISTPMFGIAAGILVFFIVVVLYVYWMRPGRNLSHLPTTLAATYTLLYASNAMEDSERLSGRSPKERAVKLEGLGNTYGYGFFVGWDKHRHFGVYKEKEVSPIESRNEAA